MLLVGLRNKTLRPPRQAYFKLPRGCFCIDMFPIAKLNNDYSLKVGKHATAAQKTCRATDQQIHPAYKQRSKVEVRLRVRTSVTFAEVIRTCNVRI
jgi:hypothetical protein